MVSIYSFTELIYMIIFYSKMKKNITQSFSLVKESGIYNELRYRTEYSKIVLDLEWHIVYKNEKCMKF